MKRKLLLIIVLTLGMCMLTGCEINMSVFNGVTDTVNDRFDSTREVTNNLESQGFISKDTADTIRSNIDTLVSTWNEISATGTLKVDGKDDARKKINKLIKNSNMNIVEACSAIRCIGHGVTGFNEDKENAISDYIMMEIWNGPENGGKDPWQWTFKDGALDDKGFPPTKVGGDYAYIDDKSSGTLWTRDETYNPITIVPNSVSDDINETLEFPIYVLRPDVYEQLGNNSSLDSLYNTLKYYFYEGGDINAGLKKDIADTALLDYFHEVKVDGKALTLKYLIEKNSAMDYWDNILLTTTWNSGTTNEVGKDIIIQQTIKTESNGTITEPVLSVRLREYNHTAFENLDKVLGLFNSDGSAGRYIVSRDDHGHGNKIYLIEYPVSAIESFEAKNLNGEEMVEANFTNSGIGINIMTGSIIKYNVDTNGNYTTKGVYLKDTDNYYTSAIFGDASGKSSFSVFGYNDDVILDLQSMKESKYGHTANLGTYNITTARIVLNDYLEATYAPGYNEEDSKVVVFGRKIRFLIPDNILRKNATNFGTENVEMYNFYAFKRDDDTGELNSLPTYMSTTQQALVFDTSEDVATYVDKDGNTKARTLKIYDFCDLKALTGNGLADELGDDTVYSIAASGTEPTTVEAKTDTYSDCPEPSELRNITLNSTTKNKVINASTVFPSNNLGKIDYQNYKKSTDKLPSQQRFWVMTVRTGIFDSGLFDLWIGSTSETASLLWWNKYLDENGFEYEVSLEKTNSYLLSNYRTQVQKSGVVLIDLDTIADIAEMYEKEEDEARVRTIRTTFIVIGWGIMAFSLVLLVLWAVDTNTDIGIGLLDKATFGHWTAVKYDSDIPQNDDGHTYLTSGKMLVRCLILIAVGIILIRIDILSTVSMLISLFGRVASTIEEVIKGI